MQTKSILMALLAMALVTACTNDETIEMNQGEGISLSAIGRKGNPYGKRSHHNQQHRQIPCICL